MDIKSQYFNFKDIKLEKFIFETIVVDNNQIPNFQEIPFDIDFEILVNEENQNLDFIVVINLIVNQDKNPGYFIQTKYNCFFELKSNKISDKAKEQYIVYTALPLSINSVRMHLAQMTARGIFGEYFLPSIDLKKLFKKKENNE